jgi:hypothetical protein
MNESEKMKAANKIDPITATSLCELTKDGGKVRGVDFRSKKIGRWH